MKGLIIKDVYILKKNLHAFILVTFGVMILGVLFVLSARYGNIADYLENLKTEPMGEEEFFASYQIAVWMVLILPLAFLTMIENCFKEDRRVGFYKVRGSLPVNCFDIVGARYVTAVLLSGVALLASLFTGYMVSLATEVYSYQDICKFTFSIFSFLFIYNMAVLPFYYYFGGKRAEDTILIFPFLIFYFSGMGYFLFFYDEEEGDKILMELFDKLTHLLTNHIFVLLGIAFFTGGISFGISYLIEKKKGGVYR